jgi:DegV family protein with EDD domain
MSNVTIVTDSAGDIPLDISSALGIVVVPLSIRFGEEEFTDCVDLTPSEFWAKCASASELPATAAPSPGSFAEAFEAARAAGASGVVCLTISSELSGTYGSARTAAESMEGFEVVVIDTRAVTMAEGILTILAAEAARDGASVAEIVSLVEENLPRVGVVGALDTLEHLKKGGRVGGAQALLGSMLSIKPLLELKDGKVAEAGRQRTRAKAIAHLAKVVTEAGPYARLAVAHGSAPDLDVLLAKLADVECDTPVIVTEIGSVVGTHGGPGIIGICWLDRA